MKKLLLLLCVVAPALAVTPTSKVLLIRAADGKSAQAIADDMRITARSITYEAGSNRLVCEGEVKLGYFGGTATTERLNVHLTPEASVFFLNEKGIEVKASPAPFGPESAKRAAPPAATHP